MNNVHIGLVGAGIGGLAAALSLQRIGVRVSVFERAPEIREVGAGVIVAGPSMRGLDFLGVGDRIRDKAGKRPPGYFHMKHYASGATIQEARDVPGQELAYALHRADLHGVLLEAVLAHDPDCLHLGCEFAAFSQDADAVTVTFTNGNSATVDGLVGCDGVASVVRPATFGPEPVVYTGMVSYRGLIPAAEVTERVASENGSFYVGPEQMFLFYFVRGTEFMNVVAHARQPGWEEEGWSISADRSTLLGLYKDYCSVVHEVIEAIPEENLFKWALRDRPTLDQWTLGRVSLLGDAAHPLLPFLGQGGNMAIEDGTVLGRCFAAAADVAEALARYEATRKNRANTVQIVSRQKAEVLMAFADKDAIPFRDTGGPPSYDPATVPIATKEETVTSSTIEESRC
ncbi:FAD-dependent monooxygenase [Mycobacterium sp.]|uniref:FAD-dependent monooxygenase n=1 Tax=Mycobacterium sp. TaxID=1785 RepID=UPI003C736330